MDVVTIERSGPHRLSTGDIARRKGDTLVVDGVGVVEDGETVDLPGGAALLATKTYPEAKAGLLAGFDSTLFHAAMVGAAVQACVVSALVLAPAPAFDTEPGAGMPGEWRRLLVSPGGTAPTVGTPALDIVGRRPDDGERPEPAHAVGHAPPPAPRGKPMNVNEVLAEMSRVLHLGNDGTELKDAIGDIAQSAARAPVAGADLGGLAPKDPVEQGDGNGLIGAGLSSVQEVLHRRIAENEKKARKALSTAAPRPAIPVQLLEMPAAEFDRLSDEAALDPVVRDALAQAVRRRDNAVRSCYESRGLASDHGGSGKLRLELTLLPSGRVTETKVTVDNPRLRMVADCVEKAAAEWYLGDGLVDEPKRLSFPFVLTPRKEVRAYDFSEDVLVP